MDGLFFDGYSLAFIILPLMVACVAMHISAGVHWSLILKDLGLPLGLIMAFTAFVGMLRVANDPSGAGHATGMLLLALIYGGIPASIGYFWGFRVEGVVNLTLKPTEVKWWGPSICIMTLTAILAWFMDEAAGLDSFYSPIPLTVSASTAFIALLIINRKNVLKALSQSFLLGALLNVLIGIIYYYNDEIGPGLAIGLLGIVYGLTAYVFVYFLSFKLGDPKELDAPLMNWHWLEVSGFIIFMFLAPVSLPEFISDIEDEKKEEKVELRIQALERKLDLLSQQTAQ